MYSCGQLFSSELAIITYINDRQVIIVIILFSLVIQIVSLLITPSLWLDSLSFFIFIKDNFL